jgi:hypothetical protein
VVVFADHAFDDRFSVDGSQVVEVGHVAGALRCDVRGTLLSGLVRSVPVVVDQILAEHEGQVAFADDEDPVQEFAAQGYR